MRCVVVTAMLLLATAACGGGGGAAEEQEPECFLAAQIVADARTVDGLRDEIDRQLARDDLTDEQRRYFEELRRVLTVAPENSDVGDALEVVPCPT